MNHLKFYMIKSIINNFFVFIITFYQIYISPLFAPSCRFYPTCSNYALLSIKKYGVIKGLLYGAFRIIRCNPINRKSGYDPIK